MWLGIIQKVWKVQDLVVVKTQWLQNPPIADHHNFYFSGASITSRQENTYVDVLDTQRISAEVLADDEPSGENVAKRFQDMRATTDIHLTSYISRQIQDCLL